jgi:hypothetical protein
VPVGALFGTSFVDYAKWAARGFADPAAYILFIAALLPLLGVFVTVRATISRRPFSARFCSRWRRS